MGKTSLTIDEAALAAERAYRRGFQQGVVFTEKRGVTNEDAYKYRYETDMTKSVGAPEMCSVGDSDKVFVQCTPALFSLVERLELENKDIFQNH